MQEDHVRELTLRTYGDASLRRKARRIVRVDDEVRELAASMREVMHASAGLGLAAEQVGVDRALCVIELPPEVAQDEEGRPLYPEVQWPLVLVNPEIVSSSPGKTMCEEGCLSFPGLYAPVLRPEEVTVSYTDLENREQVLSAGGLLARAILHEYDHLQGVLFIDRIPQIKRLALSARLKRLRRETEEQNRQAF